MRDFNTRMRQGVSSYFVRFEERAGFEQCPGEDAGECSLAGLSVVAAVSVAALAVVHGAGLV